MSMITPIKKHFNFTDFIMNLVLTDLKNEDAIKRARNNEGSSITWILGHLLDYRTQVMNLLGAEKEREFQEKYGSTSAGDGSDFPQINEMFETWKNVANKINQVFENVSDEKLMETITDENTHNEQTVLDKLTFYTWHESYHVGVIGSIRKEFGYPATSEKVIESMQPAK